MHVQRLNKPLFDLPDSHPAKLFLESFVECRKECVGQELPPPFGKGCDQEWYSPVDNKQRSFSWFAYSFLSFDIQLDGWLSNAANRTDSETIMLESLPHMRSLMLECIEAAKVDCNKAVIEMANTVLEMLTLWNKCIEARAPG